MSDFNNMQSNSVNRQTSYYNRRAAQRRRQKQKRRLLLLIFVLILAVITVIVITLANKPDAEIIGVWQYDEYTKYEFNKDGTGCLFADDVHYEYTYKLSGDKIIINFEKDVVRDCDYTYSVEDDTLTLIGGDGTDGGTYKLEKQSSES